MTPPLITVDGVSKTFESGGTRTVAIDCLTFSQQEREFLVVIGPSGCGKTTLLRIVAGLLTPTAGRILHRGVPISGVPSWLAVVFQEYNRSLFPWLSVERNVRFPLSKLPRAESGRKTMEALDLVGLREFGRHYPWQLSGGMQQRVAIARAVAASPQLLLMDEPFASVDAQTRIQLEDMILDLWRRLELSVFFVTHDIDEAIFLADRVLVLSSRPSSLMGELIVDLPRPRDQLATKSDSRFLELRAKAYSMIGVVGER